MSFVDVHLKGVLFNNVRAGASQRDICQRSNLSSFTLAFILLSNFLVTPYEASVEEKFKAVWRTKHKRACTIAFV